MQLIQNRFLPGWRQGGGQCPEVTMTDPLDQDASLRCHINVARHSYCCGFTNQIVYKVNMYRKRARLRPLKNIGEILLNSSERPTDPTFFHSGIKSDIKTRD